MKNALILLIVIASALSSSAGYSLNGGPLISSLWTAGAKNSALSNSSAGYSSREAWNIFVNPALAAFTDTLELFHSRSRLNLIPPEAGESFAKRVWYTVMPAEYDTVPRFSKTWETGAVLNKKSLLNGAAAVYFRNAERQPIFISGKEIRHIEKYSSFLYAKEIGRRITLGGAVKYYNHYYGYTSSGLKFDIGIFRKTTLKKNSFISFGAAANNLGPPQDAKLVSFDTYAASEYLPQTYRIGASLEKTIPLISGIPFKNPISAAVMTEWTLLIHDFPYFYSGEPITKTTLSAGLDIYLFEILNLSASQTFMEDSNDIYYKAFGPFSWGAGLKIKSSLLKRIINTTGKMPSLDFHFGQRKTGLFQYSGTNKKDRYSYYIKTFSLSTSHSF